MATTPLEVPSTQAPPCPLTSGHRKQVKGMCRKPWKLEGKPRETRGQRAVSGGTQCLWGPQIERG